MASMAAVVTRSIAVHALRAARIRMDAPVLEVFVVKEVVLVEFVLLMRHHSSHMSAMRRVDGRLLRLAEILVFHFEFSPLCSLRYQGMNKTFLVFAFLTLPTAGWIDYLPGCNRPWVLGRYGRGRTLLSAFNRKDRRSGK